MTLPIIAIEYSLSFSPKYGEKSAVADREVSINLSPLLKERNRIWNI